MHQTQEDLRLATNRGWLPAGVFPPIDALREEQDRLIAQMDAAYADARAVADRYAAEDAATAEAMESGFRSDSPATPTTVTDPAVRTAEIRQANARAIASRDALYAFMAEATAQIRDMAPDLYEAMSAIERETQAALEEAIRIKQQNEIKLRALVPLRNWLGHEITAWDRPGWRVPYSSLGAPPAPVELELKNLVGLGQS